MHYHDTARFTAPFVVALFLWSAVEDSAFGDWPTWRADNRRSGVTQETLAPPLAERWVHKAALAPRPAWPEMPAKRDVYRKVELGPTVVFDRAFHVVLDGQSLYYGSSADDGVHCLDAATGKLRWSFYTEGPIRLAPSIADERVYAASDDGCVYCLAAAAGSLQWKHRIGPTDRRLPGNGRVISLWPARCGVVVEDETVYVCAGLFPSAGAFLSALRADDGKEMWKRRVDISAQGYLVASPKKLFVPTGRTPPHIFEREGGEQVAAFPGEGQKRSGTPEGGGSFAVLADDQLLHGGGEKGGIQITDANSREKILWTPGLRVIANGAIAYILKQDALAAVDRGRQVELARLQRKKKKSAADERRIAELTGDGESRWLKWETPCSAPYELISAGQLLVVGGEDRIAAYRARDGKQVWTGKVDGKAYSLAVSSGRLYVGTDKGAIHCFQTASLSASGADLAASPRSLPSSPYPDDRWSSLYRQAAEAAVDPGDMNKGYCLVLGANTGRLAYEIASRSDFRVIGVERDAAKADAARKLLASSGVYGRRVVIHHVEDERLPYQKWFANLVVCDETLLSGVTPVSAAEIWRVLRPSGGVVVLAAHPGATAADPLSQWGRSAIPGWKTAKAKDGRWIGMAQRGPLPNAGEWTHFLGDSGNSACSRDALAPGPVDIQWFGRPGPRRMVDRHEKNVGPLYKNGRLFISGDNYIMAVDAYNGTVLWERDLPGSIRLGAFKNCGSMAAADEHLYVASAGRCYGFDVETGEQRCVFSLPSELSEKGSEWGYVAAVGDLLFGSVTKPGAAFRVQDIDTQLLIWRDRQPVVCSDVLFALNRHTGKRLWTYAPQQGVVINPTIAVGGGRVYCVESANSKTKDVADGRIKLDMLLGEGSHLTALDVSSGETLWRGQADLRAIEHVLFLSYANETVVLTGARNAAVGDSERVRYDLCAFDAAAGRLLWQTTEKPTPDHILDGPHGEQVQHSAIVGDTIYNTGFSLDLRTGRPVPGWKWQKGEKCGAVTTSSLCAFSRYSNARMFSLQTGEHTNLTNVTRPGCWMNIIPAGGLVLIPEASSGCTCYYSIQTSLALAPRDD